MKIIYIVLLILLACGIIYAAEVKKDRPLDVGVELSADPLVHQAVYAVLKEKGISCSGLSTRKDGTVTVIGASSTEPKITAVDIQKEIDKIKSAQDIEALIQAEIRAMAIKNLISQGKIPADSK